MRVIVLLNAGAGKAADPPPASVEAAFRAVGVDAAVRQATGPGLPAAARAAAAAVAVRRRSPFVFVGNNPYQIEGLHLGARPRLDTGRLCAYFANRPNRFGLLRLALRAPFGRLNQARDFDTLTAAELSIETRRKRLRVALDGEVTRLVPPLHFRSRPGALRVLAEVGSL